ncbi:hypothetical protein AB0H00_29655 [Nocardia sp. NPDC023852]|uniref:hypothetical protein n=1 Tax=Nocardia sp. NPDC023852 TaxID=3154697 RepID=UPI0033BFFF8E
MSDDRPAAVRCCPTWCSTHYAPTETDDPDLGHMHEGLESTRMLSIWGNMPLTTSLTRVDTLAGAPESYCIELRSEDEVLVAITAAEAGYLADRLHLLIGETRREPAVQQAGSVD